MIKYYLILFVSLLSSVKAAYVLEVHQSILDADATKINIAASKLGDFLKDYDFKATRREPSRRKECLAKINSVAFKSNGINTLINSEIIKLKPITEKRIKMFSPTLFQTNTGKLQLMPVEKVALVAAVSENITDVKNESLVLNSIIKQFKSDACNYQDAISIEIQPALTALRKQEREIKVEIELAKNVRANAKKKGHAV